MSDETEPREQLTRSGKRLVSLHNITDETDIDAVAEEIFQALQEIPATEVGNDTSDGSRSE